MSGPATLCARRDSNPQPAGSNQAVPGRSPGVALSTNRGVGGYSRTPPDSTQLVYALVYGANSGGVVGERVAAVG
jgi:hypothetical protein